jgi:hypothetical protein
MKSIFLTERTRLRAELTSTNFLNHPNYDNPNTNISDLGTVGVINGVAGVSELDGSGARSFRAGLRFEW